MSWRPSENAAYEFILNSPEVIIFLWWYVRWEVSGSETTIILIKKIIYCNYYEELTGENNNETVLEELKSFDTKNGPPGRKGWETLI